MSEWRISRLAGAALIGIASLGLGACDDLVLEESPPHIIVADNLYTNAEGFQAGLNALYAQVRKERQGTSGINELMNEPFTVGVDNAFSNYVSTTERIWNEWTVRNNSTAGIYLDIWNWLYQTINAANTIIARAENPDIDWTQAEKNRVLGEARLFRAWAYRHLTYMWGDVPLNLEESSGESVRTDWERTPKAEVWAQMEQDLLFAEQNLPPVTPRGDRLTSAVAQHYLAELYLAMGRPAEAEAKAAAVINSGNYRLITSRYGVRANQPGVPFMDQFVDGNVNRNQGNTEVLWALQWQQEVLGGGVGAMRRYWVNRYYNNKIAVSHEFGGRGIGRLGPTRWALNLYEPQDDRGSEYAIRKFYTYNDASILPAGKQLGDTLKLSWTAAEKINNSLWPSTRKWDWTDPLNPSIDEHYGDQPYIRLAETYLLLAEAQFMQGRTADAAATINVVRQRANATPITAADVTLDFILDERSRELLTEEQRRHTLVRTHKWLERTRAYNMLAGPVITERDTIFPIPQAVIDANLTRPMPQNPGY